MNILYLCPSQQLGLRDRAGWSTHMRSVITALRAHGHAVRQYVAAGAGPPPPAAYEWLRRVTPAGLRLARRDVIEFFHDRALDEKVMAACQESQIEAIYERAHVYHAVGKPVRSAAR